MDTFMVLLFFVAPAASGFFVQRTRSGKDVTLRCHVYGDVPITAVKWTRDDLKTPTYVLSHSDGRSDPTNQHPSIKGRVELVDRGLMSGDMSLFLRNVSVNDGGMYTCRVTGGRSDYNKRNETNSDPVKRIKLVVRDSGYFVRRTQPGKDVTLSCQVDADVSIRAVEWTRDNLKAPKYVLSYSDGRSDPTNQHSSFKYRVELADRELKNGDVSLILRKVRVSDAGMYECRVADGGSEQNKRNETDADLIKRIKLVVTEAGSKKKISPAGNPGRSWKIALKVVGSLIVGSAAAIAWRCKRRRDKRSEEPAADETVGDQVI